MTGADEDGLAALLGGPLPHGIVHVPQGRAAGDVLDAAHVTGWQTVRLSLDGVADKAGFLDACARRLGLPEWFGHNWDALHDCLTDPDWALPGHATPGRRLVLVTGWTALAEAAPAEWETAQRVLADAVGHWRSTATPLLVVVDRPPADPFADAFEDPLTDPEPPTPGTSG
ncbi:MULTISPECIES: barstar family protein [Streptomycetaceae]|uniref:Barstar (barnase inhibitor) domain-containing protein n=1 Tax=Streptantibioticus cattleyicolor (strain ATCC 35852 / DSM 46488 / JCM 4925 / NBRC 14057 / NRRL 8057) TaxID=1003195 RepID=F8K503_STREN|nr:MULTISPECIES: barstar family protein [Streptomycetaceae]AEW97726.1 hypothetical protein SCATT_53550 [Streptantibioticus cattleyicolor NRRL 8057 = DSM 46488]MYS62150.1 hypothetical protein [Streptomyces sp. SID5468]CCB78045.1 conserved protein of unknown function [Streptantibioticus cattleyicolor NRRL 8057 = DSM 46488]